MFRNHGGSTWSSKAAIFVVAGVSAGVGLGLLLGGLGQHVVTDARAAAAAVLGLVAVAVGGLELSGRRLRLLQCNRETPQSWVSLGAWKWAITNGASLGCGAASRLGFWSWYLVPLAAFGVGDPLAGAAIYGTYGGVRTLAPLGLVVAHRALGAEHDFHYRAQWLLRHHAAARRVSGVHLVAVGVFVALVTGP